MVQLSNSYPNRSHHQTRAQRKRVASEKEEQRSECALTFEKSRSKRYKACSDVVPVTGLEPVRHRWRWILSPLRLPFHHTGMVYILFCYLHIRRIRFASAGVRLRCPKFSVRCPLTKFRPLPIAQVASSATGGAPFAPQTLTVPPSLAAYFEFSAQQVRQR